MSKNKPIGLVWLRQDLRSEDNAALYHASLKGDVIAIYLEASEQHQVHSESEAKISLRKDTVKELREELNQLNIPLIYQEISNFDKSSKALLSYMYSLNINSIYFNNEYLLNERSRDKQVEEDLKNRGYEVIRFDSDLILPPNQLKTLKGDNFKVFTPYKKAWFKYLEQHGLTLYPKPEKQKLNLGDYEQLEIKSDIKYRHDIWSANSGKQVEQYQSFLKKVTNYSKHRDFPSIKGTSCLSPYFAIGSLSVKWAADNLIRDLVNNGDLDWQSNVWLSELIWRDFYRQIMINDMEKLCKHYPFKKTKEPWVKGEEAIRRFEAWKLGRTGFPIVDAAMKQLLKTGWMHNRLRMVVAMFLTKLCLVDWRWGEKYFMEQLVDGDFASNNGGWQWSASTGSDAVPYFRIMNPTSQSKKFDNDGAFIKKFLPELSSLNKKDIHSPTLEQCKALGYPEPIIDYKESRKLALELLA